MIHWTSHPDYGDAITGTFFDTGHCVARPHSGIWWRWQVTMGLDTAGRPVQKREGWAEGPDDAKVQMSEAAEACALSARIAPADSATS